MQDKIIKVTFTAASKREPYIEELSKLANQQLINQPANDARHMQVCAMIAANGLVIKATSTYVDYAAPSQIDKIEIIYKTGALGLIKNALGAEA